MKKKKEDGLTTLAAKIGGIAGRASAAIERASIALKEKVTGVSTSVEPSDKT